MLRGKVCAPLIALLLPLAWPADAPARPETPAAAQSKNKRPAAPRVAAALQGLADWVHGRGGALSARVSEADSGVAWAESGADTPLNPASNMKILTAAAALDQLGAEYRFSTGLYGERSGDRVEALVLRGHGDPSLSLPDLWQLARALSNLGVRHVGRVLVDQSRFDAQFVPPAFEQQPHEWAGFRAPVSAVALERNVVTLHVLPAAAGQPARAWFDPPGVVRVEGLVETRRTGSGESIQLTLEPRPEALVARIGGHVSEGMPRMRFERRLDDPRLAPGLALAALLADSGVEVRGPVALGGADVTPRLVFHESEPLGQLLAALGKNSDNFYAEMLLKVLGAEAGAAPASSQDGARALQTWLARHGLAGPKTRIENGSGLFDANRISAATLVRVLSYAYRQPALYPELVAQLAVGGVDGTLRSRFRKLTPRRVVRAKTGTLAATIGLSGYVLSGGGRAPIAFSFLVDGVEGHTGEARQRVDRVVEAIVSTRYAAP